MPSLARIIAGHNSKVLRGGGATPQGPNCNCRGKPCPMEGRRCCDPGVIYQATVAEDNGSSETYLGLSEPSWKLRFNNHTASFKHRHKRTETMLSKHVWKLKDEGKEFEFEKWKILARGKAYSPSSNCCRLCLKEKYFLMFKPEQGTLNKRNEFYSHCRHMASWLV